MDLFRMRCFVSVAENKSLSKAAREMFISQPAMTAQMNALEKELGAQLLVRGHSTAITSTGELVLTSFRSMLSEYDDLLRGVHESEAATRGRIRLGFHGPVGWGNVGTSISEFKVSHPGVEVALVIDTWTNLLAMLREGTLDLAFMEMSEVEGVSDIAAHPLFEEPICAVLPVGHKLASRELVSVADVRDEILLLPDPSIAPHFFKRLHASFERAGVRVGHTGAGNHYEATVVLVAAGEGISCMPGTYFAGLDSVVAVPFSDLGMGMRYVIAWNRASSSSVASEFVKFADAREWR